MKPTLQELKYLGLIWLIWQVLLRIAGFIAPELIPYQPTFPYAETLLAPSGLPQWIYSWAGFDGVHYLTIAQKGYLGTGLIQAFFPVVPLFIRAVSLVMPLVIAGITVGLVSSACLVVVWYVFAKHFFSVSFAKVSLLVLLLFPTSFYFTAVYTEAIFLSLTLLAFYFVDKKQWLWAVLVTGLATATRITGVFLVPALVVSMVYPKYSFYMDSIKSSSELFSSIRKQFLCHWKVILFLTLGFSGLVLYMLYLTKFFQDPLYFYHVQSEFGSGREERIIWWPQVVWRYFKIFATQSSIGWHTLSLFQEFMAGVGGILVLILGSKWIKPAWAVFGVFAALLPTLTGTFSSMPRYILLSFPLFILLTLFLKKYPKFRWFYFSVSGMLLLINTMLFIQGYWVA